MKTLSWPSRVFFSYFIYCIFWPVDEELCPNGTTEGLCDGLQIAFQIIKAICSPSHKTLVAPFRHNSSCSTLRWCCEKMTDCNSIKSMIILSQWVMYMKILFRTINYERLSRYFEQASITSQFSVSLLAAKSKSSPKIYDYWPYIVLKCIP